MTRINVTIEDGIEPIVAMDLIRDVVAGGKISTANVGREPVTHYCWATTYRKGGGHIIVWTRKKKSPKSADSFHVYQETTTNPQTE